VELAKKPRQPYCPALRLNLLDTRVHVRAQLDQLPSQLLDLFLQLPTGRTKKFQHVLDDITIRMVFLYALAFNRTATAWPLGTQAGEALAALDCFQTHISAQQRRRRTKTESRKTSAPAPKP
jgi:hypothetical protein